MSDNEMELDLMIYGTAYMKCYVDPKTNEAKTEHVPMKDIYKGLKTLNDLVTVESAKFLPRVDTND